MAGSFKEYVYNPLFLADKYEEDIGLIDRAAIRADYSKMRKLANQRLKRFEGTQWTKSAIYKFNKNRFKRLDEVKSVEELANLIVEVKSFIENPLSTITGQQRNIKKKVEKLHEVGFTFVNTKNFSDFAMFMDRMRALSLSSQYDSEQAAEVWNKLRKEGAKPAEVAEAFNQYTNEQLKEAPKAGERVAVSSNRISEIWRKTRKT